MVSITENFGAALDSARVAVVAFHGIGGNAGKMKNACLATGMDDVAFFAPEAGGGQGWWREGFETPLSPNDPELQAALAVVEAHVDYLLSEGFDYSQIVLAGFSQGAALVLEHLAITGRDYLGVVSMSGALLGTTSGGTDRYEGDLTGQHVTLSAHDGDPKVTLDHVMETKELLEARGAVVELSVSEGVAHGLSGADIDALVAVANRTDNISLRNTSLVEAVGDDANNTIIGNSIDNDLRGKAGNDLLKGRHGRDLLHGGRDADDLRGGLGNDNIDGGPGRDRILGGPGSDKIYGMGGADILDGGKGEDVFVYLSVTDSRPGECDLIVDFRRGIDALDLRAIDANRTTQDHDPFDFIGREDFTGTAGELRITGDPSATHFLEADVNGDGRADFSIEFAAGTSVPLDTDILV